MVNISTFFVFKGGNRPNTPSGSALSADVVVLNLFLIAHHLVAFCCRCTSPVLEEISLLNCTNVCYNRQIN